MKLSWNRTGLKYRLLILGAGLLLVSWFFLYFLYWPQKQEIARLASTYANERQKVNIISTFAKNNPQPEKYLADVNQRLARVDKLLPDKSGFDEFLVQIEQAAKSAQIQIVQIRPAPVTAKNGYREYPAEIVIKGDFFQTMNFIRKLEDGTRFNIVNSIVMQSKQELLETKLTVSVFSFGAPANANSNVNTGPKAQK